MANIDTTTKPMAQKEGTELKAIFQASPTDPYANLLWESNRTPFSKIFFVYDASDIEKRSIFDPITKTWTTISRGQSVRPENFTRDFTYGGIGYYSYSEGTTYNSLNFNSVYQGISTFYPSTSMPSSFEELCKTGLNPQAIWGRKDCSLTYYSDGDNQYVYNKSTRRFSTITHITSDNRLFKPNPAYMWAVGDRLFHSYGTNHYEFKYDVSRDTWVWDPVTFSGITSFYADGIWSDGDNTYCRETNTRIRQLDPATLTWSAPFDINVPVTIHSAVFTDGHSCYLKFTYNSETQEYSYYEWDKYHKIWVQKTGSNIDFKNDYNDYLFNDANTLVANYGNWGTDQEPYKDSMWATNGSVKRAGTTFYARFWPNANNSYKEINNE